MSIPTHTDLLLALEGGGTRSQAALLDSGGQVLALSPAADVNTNFTPYAQAQAAVRAAVSNALLSAGRPGSAVAYVARALVGPRFGPETFGDLLPNARYLDYGERDVVFARAGLDVRFAHGVALVAATGATAFACRADDGRQLALGGWGALLGDEGSAYALGLLALRAVARAAEGRAGCDTGLVEALAAHFAIDLAHFKGGLIRVAYGTRASEDGQESARPGLTRAQIGGLAPLVTGLAAGGDLLAGRLVAKVAGDLAALALHAARRLFRPDETFDVVASGGLINGGELVLAPLRAGLAAEFPNAVLRIGADDPAIALGLQALRDLNASTSGEAAG